MTQTHIVRQRRVVALAALALLTTLPLATTPASAGPGYDPKYRFCVSGMSPALGPDIPDCSYNTWEECRFSASGHGYCIENPVYAGQSQRRKR